MEIEEKIKAYGCIPDKGRCIGHHHFRLADGSLWVHHEMSREFYSTKCRSAESNNWDMPGNTIEAYRAIEAFEAGQKYGYKGTE